MKNREKTKEEVVEHKKYIDDLYKKGTESFLKGK